MKEADSYFHRFIITALSPFHMYLLWAAANNEGVYSKIAEIPVLTHTDRQRIKPTQKAVASIYKRVRGIISKMKEEESKFFNQMLKLDKIVQHEVFGKLKSKAAAKRLKTIIENVSFLSINSGWIILK